MEILVLEGYAKDGTVMHKAKPSRMLGENS